jgi:hypothetical protein
MMRTPYAARHGFGAARVRLRPPPHRRGAAPDSLWAGLRALAAELGSGGGAGAVLRSLPSMAFAAVLAGAVLLALARDPADSNVEIAWLRTEPAESVPEPEEVRVVEPEPAPAPPAVAELPPPPEPPRQRPEPPPAPRVAAKPEPPPAPRVAAKPEPPPPSRRAPAPSPVRRRATAALAIDPLAAAPLPKESVTVGRSRRPTTRPAAPSPPRVGIDPLGAAPAPAAPARARRSAPSRQAPSRPSRSLALPAVASAPAVAEPTFAGPQRATREAPRREGGGSSASPGLRAVALGALAACRSDREEDALKRRVVAAVAKPEECMSEAGRWRFVETRNLNAFLMWVERSPSRRAGNRCEELGLALDCLVRGTRRELRGG